MNLRKEARGRDCTVRLPGICNGNPETTVYAHIRQMGITGMGYKPDARKGQFEPGAFCCAACHDVIDGRMPTYMDPADVSNAHYRGFVETWGMFFSEGKVVYGRTKC